MYDLAMTIYFGIYGATMTTNSELFWGPDSLMMLPYMSSAADAQSAFFQRMTGLGFAIMSLGYAKCGVSKDAWIKQTMLFHVVSTPIFFFQCASDDGTSFTPWVWYLQIAINIVLAGWGSRLCVGNSTRRWRGGRHRRRDAHHSLAQVTPR